MSRLLEVASRFLGKLNAPIARWGLSVSALLLALMLVVALAQIISRGVFNHTLDWAEELARMALVWSALLAAPYGYRSASHVAINLFVEALPPKLIYLTGVVVNALVIWICAVFFIESLALVERGMTLVATALPLRMAWIYAIVPITLSLLILVAIEATLALIGAWRSGETRVDWRVGVIPLLEQQDRD